MNRVVVTGIGIISPLGNFAESHFSNLFMGNSGVRRLGCDFVDRLECKIGAPVIGFDAVDYFGKQAKTLDRATQFSVIAASQAFVDSSLVFDDEDYGRIGVYLGTSMGGLNSIDAAYAKLHNNERMRPLTVLMTMSNAAASQIALDFNLYGPCLTYSCACASSSVAIGEAYKLIRSGDADVMLAGGTETLLTLGSIKAWEALHTLADEDLQDVGKSCKPFSKNRSGLVLGEGAAMVVLESLQHALDRDAKIYGEIIGYASTNDSAHITQPSVEGQARAMVAAIKSANINPSAIDYINAHGTGTLLNDATETAAIKQVFGNSTPVSSTKGQHGHLMGAAGAVEFVTCLQAIEHQILPATANLDEPDPVCDLDYVPKVRNAKVNTVMSNSFAFGGTSAVLIIEKVKPLAMGEIG